MEKTFFKVKFNSQNQEDTIYSNGIETSVFNENEFGKTNSKC